MNQEERERLADWHDGEADVTEKALNKDATLEDPLYDADELKDMIDKHHATATFLRDPTQGGEFVKVPNVHVDPIMLELYVNNNFIVPAGEHIGDRLRTALGITTKEGGEDVRS